MKHLIQFVVLLCACFLSAPVKAQNGNVQADMSTGLLWRPAALFTNATNVSQIASSLAPTFQPLDSDLTAIAALTTTAYGRSFLDRADAAAARTLIGLSSADSPTFTALTLTGNATVGGGVDVTNGVFVRGRNAPTSGSGVELFYYNSVGYLAPYTVGSPNTMRRMIYDASEHTMQIGGSNALSIAPTTKNVSIASTTASTSSATGALTVGGGLGVAGAGYFGGQVAASHSSSGSANSAFTNTHAGGYGLLSRGGSTAGTTQYVARFADYNNADALTVYSDKVAVAATTEATTAGAGSLTTAGGIYAAKQIISGSNHISNYVTAANGGEYGVFQANIGADGTLGPLIVTLGGSPSATGNSRYYYLTSGDNAAYRTLYLNSKPSGGGPVVMKSTTEATTAGNGSLATDGGIYAAKKVVAMGGVTIQEHTLTRTNSTTLTLNNGLTVGGQLMTGSGRVMTAAVKTTAYTVANTDHVLIGNHASTPFTFTMIDAATNSGREYYFKNKGAATVTIDATALGQIFDGSAVNTITLTTGQSAHLISDGATWNRF